MDSEPHRFYDALAAHDARFDGVFFVGVTSTRIYCRPVCRVKIPKRANCRFFDTAHQAEHAGFRPCLRCRPELAPGLAPVEDGQRIAHLIVQRLEAGQLDEEPGLEAIASQFELSSRQIRRIVRQELGVSPIQLLLTRRLLLAKQLLTETGLSMTDIAFASGFASVRRFNDAFVRRYRLSPSQLRRRAIDGPVAVPDRATSTLQLAYRPPYDWEGVLAFLGARALKGVEHVTSDAYARTVRLAASSGWIRVTRASARDALLLEFTHTLMPVLPGLLSRVRGLFDLDARPDVIASRLGADPRLAPIVKANPGMRVPGAFSGFELGLRAIVGQQITVKGATTIAGRLVQALGDPLVTPFPELTHASPFPSRLARARVPDLARHGLIAARARSVIALAKAHLAGDLSLEDGVHPDPEASIRRLSELPGIGAWTAHYVAMRALRWPDAFPKEDVAIRKALGGVRAGEAETLSQAWRPWRSYAVMHLWRASSAR